MIHKELLDEKIAVKKTEAIEVLNGQKLHDFRTVVTSKMCGIFRNLDQLRLIVFQSLSTFERNDQLAGWVRGSDVINPKAILEENEKLKEEVASLEATLSTIEEPKEISLSDDATRLLLAALEGGLISVYQTGEVIVERERICSEVSPPRERARWTAAVNELRSTECIEHRYTGKFDVGYRVTKRGFDHADKVKAKASADPAGGSTRQP